MRLSLLDSLGYFVVLFLLLICFLFGINTKSYLIFHDASLNFIHSSYGILGMMTLEIE